LANSCLTLWNALDDHRIFYSEPRSLKKLESRRPAAIGRQKNMSLTPLAGCGGGSTPL
jgi:hypothetical protein